MFLTLLRGCGEHRGWYRLPLFGDPDSTVVVFAKDGDRIRHTFTAHSMPGSAN